MKSSSSIIGKIKKIINHDILDDTNPLPTLPFRTMEIGDTLRKKSGNIWIFKDNNVEFKNFYRNPEIFIEFLKDTEQIQGSFWDLYKDEISVSPNKQNIIFSEITTNEFNISKWINSTLPFEQQANEQITSIQHESLANSNNQPNNNFFSTLNQPATIPNTFGTQLQNANTIIPIQLSVPGLTIPAFGTQQQSQQSSVDTSGLQSTQTIPTFGTQPQGLIDTPGLQNSAPLPGLISAPPSTIPAFQLPNPPLIPIIVPPSTIPAFQLPPTPSIPTTFNGSFFDYIHEIVVPMEERSINNIDLPIGISTFKIKSVYNFYIKSFEQTIQNVDERLLPTIYGFNAENNNDLLLNKTLGGILTKNDNYFEQWSQNFSKYVSSPIAANQQQKFSNIIFNKNTSIPTALFPMYIDLQWTPDRNNQISEAINNNNLFDKLILDIATNKISFNELDATEFNEVDSQEIRSGQLSKRISAQKIVKKIFDIQGWFENIGKNLINSENNFVSFLDFKTPKTSLFYQKISSMIMMGKLKALLRQKVRTFAEILSKEICPSETLLYKIEKKDLSDNLIQTFWFPNLGNVEQFTLRDSQVKYGKSYKYFVSGYQLILGNNLIYDTKKFQNENFEIEVLNKISLVLTENLLFSTQIKIIDNPPIAPDIQIIPYKGNDSNLLFFFNSGIGRNVEFPQYIEETDREKYLDVFESQQVSSTSKIEFKNDDPASKFEIFRVDFSPKNISDFKGHKIATIATDVSLETEQEASSASFIDSIIPNRKYFYLFRCLDIHDNLSNPTNIYEVQLINNSGAIYPIIKLFEPIEKGASEKIFKKILRIRPAFNQKILNKEKSGLENAGSVLSIEKFHLGIENEQLWTIPLKVRLRSISTGKIIDFNFKFVHNYVREKKK